QVHPVQSQVGGAAEDDAVNYHVLFKQEEADPVYEHIQDHGDSPHAEIRLFLDAQQPQDLLAAAGASRRQRHARPDAAYQPADDAGRDCLVKQSFRRDRDQGQKGTVTDDAKGGLCKEKVPEPEPGNQ
ncbi:DUF4830 domain-containing protein, partial [Dysosmobacter welbionis]